MPKKAVGNNPLYSSRGVNKVTSEKTDNQNVKKENQVFPDSTKSSKGKLDFENKIKK